MKKKNPISEEELLQELQEVRDLQEYLTVPYHECIPLRRALDVWGDKYDIDTEIQPTLCNLVLGGFVSLVKTSEDTLIILND